MDAVVVLILKRLRVFGGERGRAGEVHLRLPEFSCLPPSDVLSCPQGYPRTTPGSTTSTVEMSPGTLPILSLLLEAALSAGMSWVWGPQKPLRTHLLKLIKA